MPKLAVFIGAGGEVGWARLRMAFLKPAKESFQELKRRNVMVRFTFFKDHLDIPINDKLNAKKKRKGEN